MLGGSSSSGTDGSQEEQDDFFVGIPWEAPPGFFPDISNISLDPDEDQEEEEEGPARGWGREEEKDPLVDIRWIPPEEKSCVRILVVEEAGFEPRGGCIVCGRGPVQEDLWYELSPKNHWFLIEYCQLTFYDVYDKAYICFNCFDANAIASFVETKVAMWARMSTGKSSIGDVASFVGGAVTLS